MKVLVKKKVCGSHEQCMGPTRKHCPSLILLVKEVVGPVHSARDPLTDNMFTCFSIKKKKKKGDTQHGNANPNAYLRFVWIQLILLKT